MTGPRIPGAGLAGLLLTACAASAPPVGPSLPGSIGVTPEAGPPAAPARNVEAEDVDLGPPAATVDEPKDASSPNAPNAQASLPSDAGSFDAAAGMGESLTGDQIESVFRVHAVDVKRTCWERLASAVNDPPRASEWVALTINGRGKVVKAIASGNAPNVGKCLGKEMRAWTFTATGGETRVNIPFHFVRQ